MHFSEISVSVFKEMPHSAEADPVQDEVLSTHVVYLVVFSASFVNLL